ncbi:DMT family transporter [Clostridium uliginosum]|uniref:Threonine/homoserine efflux transporter RhtA n=1 Tax=Clostridium uliginosum TaxID=119641 RepID=A0A1I1PQQ0_9CLOT|nr:DMT family transporter [Clostridium uliginosum]SFD12161.1 Threonine/homoserine efflux transporter RhtA [Clostridium uliginosum]
MNNYKGLTYAILSSVAFGLMPIFSKIAYKNGSNPTTVLIFRFFLASLILFIYLKYKNINLRIEKKQLTLLLLTGILGYTLTTQTLFLSYDYLGAGLATTFHFIYPAVVSIIGFIFFKDKISIRKITSLILSGIGVYSLIAFENQTLNSLGIFLALFSGVSYGLNIITLDLKLLKSIDNIIVTMYICIGATIGMILYGLLSNSIILEFNFKIVESYIVISTISTIASMILFLKAMDIIGAASSSILGTFEPIVSIILGIVFLGEHLSTALILGCILILTSTIILAKDKDNINETETSTLSN